MIKYYDRSSKSYKTEKVAGNKALDWTYSTPIGKSFLELLIKKKLFSSIYGSFCDTEYSSKNIDKFIRDLDINMDRYKKQFSFQFGSFNDFFIRELKDEYLNFNIDPKSLISPCDGKLLAYENIDIDSLVQVKGFTYTLKELIGDDTLSKEYAGGTCLIFRLCPTDYHRFHFIDNGTCTKSTFINGNYYSVNPIALNKISKLYCSNKREWSILNSENFKEVLYIEVGATCVGTIVQTYSPNTEVIRGEEKGYFKFGGSTVILFLKKDTVKIDEDIIIHTNQGFETAVNLGDIVGSKI